MIEFRIHKLEHYAEVVRYKDEGDGTVYLSIPDFFRDAPVTEIEAAAFENCATIQVVKLPESIRRIGPRAFYGCSNLKAIVATDIDESQDTTKLPGCLEEIGYEAFYGTALKDVKVDAKSISIGGSAFSDCQKLRNIVFTQNCCNVELGEGVFCRSAIEALVFQDQSVVLGSVPPYTFDGCMRLMNVQFSAYEIGTAAFRGCVSLRHLRLCNGLETLSSECFSGTLIKSLVLPPSLSCADARSFSGSNLQEILVDPRNKIFSSSDGLLCDRNMHVLVCVPPKRGGNIALPDTIGAIGIAACQHCNLDNVTLGHADLVFLGTGAFQGAKIDSITLPKGLRVIGRNAFENAYIYHMHINCQCELSELRNTRIENLYFYGDEAAFETTNCGCQAKRLFLMDASGSFYRKGTAKTSLLFEYIEFESEIMITHIASFLNHICIPEYIDGKKVVGLEPNAISNTLTEVYLPDAISGGCSDWV